MIEYAPPLGTNPAPIDESDHADGEKFGRLAAEWKSQSEFLSSPTAIAGLPAYQAIIEMGQAAVPLILDELRREPDHWFVALKRITGEDPMPDDARGEINRMAAAWLDWGRVHGIWRPPPTFSGIPVPGPRQSRSHEPLNPSIQLHRLGSGG